MRTFARNVAELIHFEEETPRCAVGRAFRATAAHLRQKASAGLVVFFCTLGGYMCAVDAAWRLLNVRTDILDSLDRERARTCQFTIWAGGVCILCARERPVR